MIGHHLAFALRMLVRHRAFAAINIGGLALGLAGCLMIWSYVSYERGYDRWLPDHERVFQVQATWREPGQPVTRSQASPFPVRQTLPGGFPQIEAITVVRPGPAPVTRNGEPVFVETAAVDPSFFDIFPLPFLHGSARTALPDTDTVVLTESEALKQFGRTDVVGRTLSSGAGEGRRDRRVGGVLRDLPKNSSLRFGLLSRWNAAGAADWPIEERSWGVMNQQHYVKLRPGADAAAINAALPAWEKRVVTPQVIGGRSVSQADFMDLKLVPLADIHLGEAQSQGLAPGGDPRTLATFMIIAVLTLGMAVMNFVNLSTARAAQRAREVALRKVLGATRGQLAGQMLVESLVVTGVAMLVALAIVELATPLIADAADATLRFGYLGEGGSLVPAVGLWLATGLAGGLYPALHLSRFRPGEVLRANKSTVETPGSGRLRTGLVLLQFAVAIGLIASTWVIQAQTDFIARMDPGYRRDGLIQIDSAWRFAGDSAEYDAASRELLRVPGVVSAGRTNLALAAANKNLSVAIAPGAVQDLSVGAYAIDPGFFTTMNIRLLAGRLPTDTRGEDVVRRDGLGPTTNAAVNVVINRAAARALNLGEPSDAVGKVFRLGVDGGDGTTPATVVGVVGDTRIRTPRDPLEPIVYLYDPTRTSQVLVRYAGAAPSDVMAGIRRVWRKFEPEIPFDARFAEDILAETYAAERTRGVLFLGFAGLAIAIACLGLYSLAAFATERRTKEIGIRKVLGATVRHIVRLLAWQFSKPVVAANLLAWPVAWWAMRDWLNGFDARVALTPGPFALAGLLALAVALATVSGHALRVARLNPVHALRYE
ncbi:MAG TPA: ABC transporter permease [Sphingomonas sp.]